MIFEEENSIKIPLEYKSFIYFLIQDGIVVYVGQTKNGLIRPFSHQNKKYNELRIILTDEEKLDLVEDEYILKYMPIYNKKVNTMYNMKTARDKIREATATEVTINDIKKVMKELNIKLDIYNEHQICRIDDIKKIIEYIKENDYGCN